ncbi:MAG TPA: VIT1/CCC1 transporter family protein [Candidatus Thermoplasmatota archaeon]|nr:VIT1/CCC1 transporter family protein [Candidatus Thermoplasmatota archaeon]
MKKVVASKHQKRYLIRGFIDGVLSSLGVVIGASTAIGATVGSNNATAASAIIIAAGIGGGVANGLSNILGASVGEKLVKEIELGEIEKAMLKRGGELHGTAVDDKLNEKLWSSAIYDGIATFIGSSIPVLPFIIGALFLITDMIALYTSIIISLVVFFILGIYIGKIAREQVMISGLKLVAFGVVTVIITTLIRTIL